MGLWMSEKNFNSAVRKTAAIVWDNINKCFDSPTNRCLKCVKLTGLEKFCCGFVTNDLGFHKASFMWQVFYYLTTGKVKRIEV